MKPASFFLALVFFTAAASPLLAQRSIGDIGGGSGFDSGDIGVKVPDRKPESKTVTYTLISKERTWKSSDGKEVKASLLGWKLPDGTIEVIREKNIRVMIEKTKKVFQFPLERLSEDDQSFVKTTQIQFERMAEAKEAAAEGAMKEGEKAEPKEGAGGDQK